MRVFADFPILCFLVVANLWFSRSWCVFLGEGGGSVTEQIISTYYLQWWGCDEEPTGSSLVSSTSEEIGIVDETSHMIYSGGLVEIRGFFTLSTTLDSSLLHFSRNGIQRFNAFYGGFLKI